MNITKMIQENIRATANRRNDEGIITAEGMIPRMDDKEFLMRIVLLQKSLTFFTQKKETDHSQFLWKFMEGRGILDKSVP